MYAANSIQKRTNVSAGRLVLEHAHSAVALNTIGGLHRGHGLLILSTDRLQNGLDG